VVSEIDGFLAMEVAHQILDKIGKANSMIIQDANDNEPMPLED